MAIIANFAEGETKTYTKSMYQYDRGQTLVITGVTLPETYEVYVSNQKDVGFANPVSCNAEGIDIPDAFFMSGEYIYVWVYAIASRRTPAYQIDPENQTTVYTEDDEDEEKSGTTVYEIVIPIKKRPIQLQFEYERKDTVVGYIVDDQHRLVPVRK